jgi:hypothetical protein
MNLKNNYFFLSLFFLFLHTHSTAASLIELPQELVIKICADSVLPFFKTNKGTSYTRIFLRFPLDNLHIRTNLRGVCKTFYALMQEKSFEELCINRIPELYFRPVIDYFPQSCIAPALRNLDNSPENLLRKTMSIALHLKAIKTIDSHPNFNDYKKSILEPLYESTGFAWEDHCYYLNLTYHDRYICIGVPVSLPPFYMHSRVGRSSL